MFIALALHTHFIFVPRAGIAFGESRCVIVKEEIKPQHIYFLLSSFDSENKTRNSVFESEIRENSASVLALANGVGMK